MSSDQESHMGQALTRATVDQEFRSQLIADPAQTLRGAGVEISHDHSVEMVEVSESRLVLVVPPYEGEQSEK